MIKNQVWKGGGVLGEAYVGAQIRLQELGLLNNLERVAGTSAGSIMAILVALRYTPQEIKTITESCDFSSFEDSKAWYNKLTSPLKGFGWYKGDTFLSWIKTQIKNKTGDENSTFADLNRLGCLDLNVYATDITFNTVRRFSVATDPTCIVAEAGRCSMSIPWFFEAFTPTRGRFKGNTFRDGGIMLNYPICAFDFSGVVNTDTIGMFLIDENNNKPANIITGNVDCAKADFEALMSKDDVELYNRFQDLNRTILIDNLGLSATNFKLTGAQKANLYASGYNAVESYYKAR